MRTWKYHQGFAGKTHSLAAVEKIREANTGERSHNWKGDAVGYASLHEWVRKRIPKPLICPRCHTRLTIDLSNKDNKYTRDLNDWEWLCRICHMEIDGRLESLRIRMQRPRCLPHEPDTHTL